MVVVLVQAPDWSAFRRDSPGWALALVVAVAAGILFALVSLRVNTARRRWKRDYLALRPDFEAVLEEFAAYRRATRRLQLRPRALTREDRVLIDKYDRAENL